MDVHERNGAQQCDDRESNLAHIGKRNKLGTPERRSGSSRQATRSQKWVDYGFSAAAASADIGLLEAANGLRRLTGPIYEFTCQLAEATVKLQTLRPR